MKRHFHYKTPKIVNSFLRHALFEGDGGAGGGGGTPTPITADSLGKLQGDSFRALLPEDIRSKPYVKEINTFGDFVKKLDGAQSLLGQRATPEETAGPDVWKGFHSKVAPKTAEEYKFPETVEGLEPEFVKNAGENKLLRPLLHAAGLSNYQASVLVPGFLKMVKAAEAADKTQKDTAFAKLSTDLFGSNKEAITTNAKKFMATHIPENVRPLLEGMDEKQLTVLLAVTDGMAKKFTGEDPFRGSGAGGGGGSAETKDQLVAQMQVIMKDPAYNDPFKDRVKNKELNEKMEAIRGKLKKIQGGT